MKKANHPIHAEVSQSHGQHTTAPTLIAAVLRHLLFVSSLNKYEAANQVGDWSLANTIFDLANHYGINITRTKEYIGKSGQPVTRYSIDTPARRHALTVLSIMDSKGKKVAA